MEDSVKNQVMEAIKTQMAQKNLSQNEWARQNSDVISVPHLSNVLNPEKWEKVSSATWQALKNKMLPGTWDVFETSNYLSIQRACADAQTNHRTVAVSAYTGAGKTTALMQYANRTPNTWYLVVRSSYSRKDLIYRIAEAMGVPSEGRTIEVEDAIINKLTGTPNALLILDSVSKLNKDASYQFIGDLAEAIEQRAGLVIAGTEFLQKYVERCCEYNKRGFRELRRRVYAWVNCPDFSTDKVKAEVVAICAENNINDPAQVAKIMSDSTCFGSLKSAIERMKVHNQRKK